MKTNQKLTYAILAALSAHAGASYAAGDASASAATTGGGIEEIVVTAQRRNESIQDVPITIQALGSDQLKQLNISSLEDALRYLPNVSYPTNGPGQGNIFMRGLSVGSAGNQSQSSISSFPSVAVYLDDQSVQFPGRNLDILAIDMQRIEVLEGPQGTLFGGGAEAGAIRYITNKPKLNVTEGYAEAGYGVTAHGDPNSSANATLNLPLIQDTLAIRAVVYSDRRGGYIDNVQSTFTRQNYDLGTPRFGVKAVAGVCPNGLPPGSAGYCVPLGLAVTNNNAQVKPAQNPVDYSGLRLSALWQMSEDWSLLVQQSYQSMEADGVFAQEPIGADGQPLQQLQTTTFVPAWDKDKFENTSWTLNGKLGVLNMVYTGGYLVRNTEQTNDYTNYARGFYGDYYQCTGGSQTFPTTVSKTGPLVCYTAAAGWHDQTRNTHQTHEFRLSTPDDWRLRGLIGAFWEDFKIQDDMNFNYKSVPSCTAANLAVALAGGPACEGNIETLPGTTAWHPGVRGDTTAFGEDLQRGYKQTAFFASVDYDIIPKVLTATAGTRWYHYSEYETGSEYFTSTGCANKPNGCAAGVNIDAEKLNKTYNGFKSRGNLTWHITPDTMVYYTYSQGYRPGAFNRAGGGKVAFGPTGVAQYIKPSGYAPDSLTNQEIGLKSEFLEHRLQVNASAYHMIWSNVQTAFFNPAALGNTTFGTNGPNYTIDGFELQVVAKVTDGLTVQGSGSWNHNKQSTSPCLVANNPAAPNFGTCITEVRNPVGQLAPFLSAFGTPGSVPANSPPLQFNVRARYDWLAGDYKAFAMVGAAHTAHSFSQTANQANGDAVTGPPSSTLLRYEMPAYSTFDATLGMAKDNWTAELFGSNLGNSNASVFTSSAQFIRSESPIRPRVIGLKIGFKF